MTYLKVINPHKGIKRMTPKEASNGPERPMVDHLIFKILKLIHSYQIK
jgi:hypothetical protein